MTSPSIESRVATLEHHVSRVRKHLNLPDVVPFGSAKAIARWNAVPFLPVESEARVGVVAFHGGGIEKVVFCLNGREIATVREATPNPDTDIVEYWTTVTAIQAGQGQSVLSAEVVPVVGHSRRLDGPMTDAIRRRNGNHALPLVFGHAGGLVVHCSGSGNDALGDGSESRPFRTVAKAADVLGKRAGGATIRCFPGDFTWGGVRHPYPTTGPAWLTIEPAAGVSRDAVRFTASVAGGFRTSLVRARNLTVAGDSILRGDGKGYCWLDGCRLIGPGRTVNSGFFSSTWWAGIYLTGCEASDNRNGLRGADLLRGCVVHTISGSPFGDAPMTVNCRTFGYDNSGTDFHGDVFHWFPKQAGFENVIAFGVEATDFPAQGLFGEIFNEALAGDAVPNDPRRRMDNVALVDVCLRQGKDGPDRRSPAGSWWELGTDHLLLWNVELPDQPFRFTQSRFATTLSNVSIQGGTYLAFTHDPLPADAQVGGVTVLDPAFHNSTPLPAGHHSAVKCLASVVAAAVVMMAMMFLAFGSSRTASAGDAPTTRPTTRPATRPVEPQLASPFLLFDGRFGFDGRLYSKVAPLRGWRAAKIIYTSAIWPGTKPGDAAQQSTPPERLTRRLARAHAADAQCPVILDIEHLDPLARSEVLLKILADWRAEVPGQRLGFYMIVPERNYWDVSQLAEAEAVIAGRAGKQPASFWLQRLPRFREAFERWRRRNDALIETYGPQVDCVFPSLYAVFVDDPNWEAYAVANIAEARRAGKSVYPFVSPFVEGDKAYVGDDAFRSMLRVTRRHADGLIVWGQIPEGHAAARIMVDFAAEVEAERAAPN